MRRLLNGKNPISQVEISYSAGAFTGRADAFSPNPMDTVRKLILEKLAEHGVTRKAASQAMGVNETYLHQFLKRGTPAELGEVERRKLSLILKVPETDLRGPQARDSDAVLIQGKRESLIEQGKAADYAPSARIDALP